MYPLATIDYGEIMNGLPSKRELYWRVRAVLESSGEVIPKTQYQVVFASIAMSIVIFFPSVYGLQELLKLLVYDIQNQVPIDTSFIPLIFAPLILFLVLWAVFLIIRLPWVVFPARMMIDEKLMMLISTSKQLDGRFLQLRPVHNSNGTVDYRLEFEVVFENGKVIRAEYITGTEVDVRPGQPIKVLFLTSGLIVPMVF